MLYVRREMQPCLAVLCVEKEILCSPGVVFTDGNVAASETRFFNSLDGLGELDWGCLEAKLWTDYDDGKRKRCAEVLVPDHIPKRRVRRIVLAHKSARRRIDAGQWPSVSIDDRPDWFF